MYFPNKERHLEFIWNYCYDAHMPSKDSNQPVMMLDWLSWSDPSGFIILICRTINTHLHDILFCLFWFFTSHQQSFSSIGTGLPGLNQYLAWINVLAQGHNTVTPVRLEPATLRSRVKHSTTEPLRSPLHEIYLSHQSGNILLIVK